MLIRFNLAGKIKSKAKHTLEDYRNELVRRVSVFKGWYAAYIVSRMMRLKEAPFAHIHQGYYAANWNVGIGSPGFSVSGQRDWEPQPDDGDDFLLKRKYIGDVEARRGKNLEFIDKSWKNENFLDDALYVTNGVWYGKWLRDGLQESDIFEPALTGGEAQKAQMNALREKLGGNVENVFVNFQTDTVRAIDEVKWKVLKAIRTEKKDKPPSARHRSKAND